MGLVQIRPSSHEIATQFNHSVYLELGGKPKWLPLHFGYNDVMRTSRIMIELVHGHAPAVGIDIYV